MFFNCTSLKAINLGIVYNYQLSFHLNMSYMFYNCSSLTSVDLSMIDVAPYDMSYMFAYCYQLKELAIETVVYINVFKSMSNAFNNCTSLVHDDLLFYTDYVEDESFMFYGCISLSNIPIRSSSTAYYYNSKYMNYMFYDCRSLKSIIYLYFFNKEFQVDLNNTNLKDISYMLLGCSSLNSIDLSNFNTKNIKNYEGLFYNCTKLQYI